MIRALGCPSRCSTVVIMALLTLANAPVHAQPPTCAWDHGITLPGCEGRTVRLLSDGGLGLLAVSAHSTGEDKSGPTNGRGTLRLHHVLEQGRLDPNLPAEGAVFFIPALSPTDQPRSQLVRVLPDGAGGAWVLVGACNPFLPKVRCWETAIARLLHVTSAGVLYPGWPDQGIVLPALRTPEVPNVWADMVEDGAGGVVVAWLQALGTTGNVATRAQRFSPDGTPQWTGGLAGRDLLPSNVPRSALNVISDRQNGAVVVVTRPLPSPAGNTSLLAARVSQSGQSLWGAFGSQVLDMPNEAEAVLGITVDVFGYTFIAAGLTNLTTLERHIGTQWLDGAGNQLWGPLGIEQGTVSQGPVATASIGATHAIAWLDALGTARYQTLDESGSPTWGPALEGVPATWSGPAVPLLFVPLPDGHLLAAYPAVPAHDSSFARVIELDGGGAPVAGWPDSGTVVCGTHSGHVFADAVLLGDYLFAGIGSIDGPYVAPKLQRMTRAALGVKPPLPLRVLELRPLSPNPSRGPWSVSFALQLEATVMLEVFDIAGRRVLERELGRFAPGPHVMPAADAGGLPAGVYRVRVRTPLHSAERMLVRVR